MTSAINGTVPANGGPLESEPIRDNFAAAKSEIEALQAVTAYQTGQIVFTPNAPAVTGWLECNGQAVSKTTYADLFAAVGTWLPINRFCRRSTKDYSDTAAFTNSVTIDPTGVYFVMGRSLSPWVDIYKQTNGSFTKLANPATLPTGSVQDVAFSSSGEYLAVLHNTSPFITIYKRSGDTFTKLDNPSTLPPYTGNAISWGANDEYLALGIGNPQRLFIYKRSVDTFTKLADPATLPAGEVSDLEFSPDGNYLLTAGVSSPYINFYQRSGDTFTKLANPASLPSNTAFGCAWSPDSAKVLIMAQEAKPFSTYSVSGSTVTADPPKRWSIAGSVAELKGCFGNKYAIATNSSSNLFYLFKYTGGEWVQESQNIYNPETTVQTMDIDPTGRYVVAGLTASPWSQIWDMTGVQTQTNFILPDLSGNAKAWIKT
jgi:WD40 repeat protein